MQNVSKYGVFSNKSIARNQHKRQRGHLCVYGFCDDNHAMLFTHLAVFIYIINGAIVLQIKTSCHVE